MDHIQQKEVAQMATMEKEHRELIERLVKEGKFPITPDKVTKEEAILITKIVKLYSKKTIALVMLKSTGGSQ